MSSQFSCKCCGHCCEGKGGIVMSRKDRERLAAHLGLSVEDMIAQYGEYANGKVRLQVGSNEKCVFFVQGTGCGVHVAKPDICRAWPFFRGNLLDPQSLALAKDFCPGIPASMSFEAFREEGLAYLRNEGLCTTEQDAPRALFIEDLE